MVNYIICAVSLLLTAIYFYSTTQIPRTLLGDPMGPRAFPFLVVVGMLLACAMLVVETLKAGGVTPARPFKWRQVRTISLVAVWTAAYLVAFGKLGYVVATPMYLLVLMAYFNRGHWVANTLTSLLFSVGSYLLFTHVLGVSLARGISPI